MDTSFLSHFNWLAVAVAAVAYFILGGLWYSKLLFANTWVKTSGVDMNRPEAKKGVGAVMVFTLLFEFLICIGLASLAYRLNLIDGMKSGIKLGLTTGICFAGPVIAISYMYQMKPRPLFFIDVMYHLLGNIIAAVIICIWH